MRLVRTDRYSLSVGGRYCNQYTLSERSSHPPLFRSDSVRLTIWDRRRVSPEESGHGTFGRQHNLFFTWANFAHLQEQGFEDFGLQQCSQMVGGEIGIVAA